MINYVILTLWKHFVLKEIYPALKIISNSNENIFIYLIVCIFPKI